MNSKIQSQSPRRRPLSNVQVTVAGLPAKENEIQGQETGKKLPVKKGNLFIEDVKVNNNKSTPSSNNENEADALRNLKNNNDQQQTSKKKTKKVTAKSLASIEVQTEDENVALVTGDEAPLKYWKNLAESRREALEQTLEENYNLRGRVEELEKENKLLEEMVEEAKTLAEMLTDLNEDEADLDESGIGIGGTTHKKELDDSVVEKDN